MNAVKTGDKGKLSRGGTEEGFFKELKKDFVKNYELYFLSLPTFIYFVIFVYFPMYGIQIAFKNFVAVKGIMGSEWVGFENFITFFNSYSFPILIKNTLGVSIYSLAVGFPAPILLALMLNEVTSTKFKKTIQMVTYVPHFISTVVVVAIMIIFLSPNTGIINNILEVLGFERQNFMAVPEYFKTIYVVSGLWQNIGWNSIIYFAALSGISPELHEAAKVDGANKLQRIRHINIPGILPTIIILLIMNMGHIMSVGFEKIFLMQNPLNMAASDVISTYVYRMGLVNQEYSFSSAVGLFNSIINLILLITVNTIVKLKGEDGLW